MSDLIPSVTCQQLVRHVEAEWPTHVSQSVHTWTHWLTNALEEEVTDLTVLLDRFADEMILTRQVPRTIEVNDPRTYALLEDFCVQEGIHLNMVANMPQLDELIMYLNHATDSDD